MAAWSWGADPDDPAQPPRRPQKAVRGPRWVWALLTTRGRLSVAVCPLCACLTVDRGQHDAVHAADVRRSDDPLTGE
jgi:hypothetical protein